jgi:predicted RNA methylase|tara:strand:+ start:15647 stop:16258 length:612 start_codon:yes stop_codon:yes gene_type:complete
MRIRHLSMALSNLEPHHCNIIALEQYSTDGNLAARFMSDIVSFGDIKEDTIVGDLGAGNGILGIAALKLGAKKVFFVETDTEACEILDNNLLSNDLQDSGEIINEHIGGIFSLPQVDLIICNPPWGKQKEKADRPFLNLILNNGSPAHLLHSSTAAHIRPFFESEGWNVEKYGEADFALPTTYSHHKRQRDKTKVGFWRLSPS